MIWTKIRDYDEYMVSDTGKVARQGHELAFRPTPKGYLRVQLWKDKKGKDFYIHRLVANAFIPNPNNYPEVNHKDGDKTNNRPSNLEWCSHRGNMKHGYRTGLLNQTGEAHSGVKLSEEKVLQIRALFTTGLYTLRRLGQEYSVNEATIRAVLKRKIWVHI